MVLSKVVIFLALISISMKVSCGQEPRLALMPETIRKNLNEAVLVSCTAVVPNDELVTNMEWRGPGGKMIPTVDGSISTLEGIGGANQLDLLINRLRVEDVGTYECVANYAANQKLKSTIEVRYFKDIDFEDTEALQTPVLNSDAKIRCIVTSEPAPLVDWLKDSRPLKDDSRVIQQADGILIKRITNQDEGVYRCRARVQALGLIKFRDIQVEVHTPPEITGAPKNVSGVEKESVAFECVAKGKPTPSYTWVNRDSEVLNEKEGYFVDEYTGELQILDLRPDHTGPYRCSAENPAGRDFAEAYLRVLTKPKIERHLNVTAPEKKRMEMQCVVSGDPLPKVVFKKETIEDDFKDGVNQGGRIEVRQSVDDQGHRVGTLIISDLQRKDDGLYTCSGVSSGGVTVSWGHITVEFTPTFEDQPQDDFWSWEQKPVNLTCLATSIPNATVQWLLREDPIREEDPNLEVLSRGPNGVLRVHPLDGSYFDDYTCRATNTIGMTQHQVSLKRVQKPGPVSSTQVVKKTATTVAWTIQDPLNDGGLPVLGYTVQFRLSNTAWDKSEQKFWSRGSSYVVDLLTPLATYVFRFAARNDVGDGEWSGEKSVEMPDRSVPEEPLIFNVNPNEAKIIPYPDHYDLQWEVPHSNGEPIESFKIEYYQVEKSGSNQWVPKGQRAENQVSAPGSSSYRLEQLNANSYYKIELRAYNKLGYSTPGEAVIKTAYGPAKPLGSVSASSTGVIAAVVIIVFLVVLVVCDVILFFVKDVGVTAFVMRRVMAGQNQKDKEAMLEDGKQSSKTLSPEGAKVVVDDTKENISEITPMISGSAQSDKEAIKKEEEDPEGGAEDPPIVDEGKQNPLTVDAEASTKDSAV